MAYNFFGLQNGKECRCGNAYGTDTQYVQKPDGQCGGPRGLGKAWKNSIFKTCYREKGNSNFNLISKAFVSIFFS